MVEYYFFLVSFFVFGLMFGSFATALAHRVPMGKNWGVSGAKDVNARRSSCPKCNHFLGVLDLMPLFSWIFTGGKCRHCKEPVSVMYPLTELVTALLFVCIFLVFGVSVGAVVVAIAVPFMMVLILIDLKYKILPNQITLLLGVIGGVYVVTLLHGSDDRMSIIQNHLFGFLVFPLLIWGVGKVMTFVLKKPSLGFGDVKLFAVCGLWCGFSYLPYVLILSGVLGVIFGVCWSFFKKEDAFPFGPAIIISLFINILMQNLDVELLTLLG